ncbi:MAG: RsmE family RNA methyltransferase [Ignavibacteria bacterium]
MELFYFPELTENQNYIRLTGDEFHHLSKVLRIKLGDEIFFTNGNGIIAKARLIKITRYDCESEILEFKRYKRSKLKFVALVPILKQEERFEFALEKLTELGIDEIQPFISQRTIKKNFRFERAQKILITAIKQSFNPFLPKLRNPIEFAEFIDELNSDDLVFFGEREGRQFLSLSKNNFDSDLKRIILTVGPEGAFTDEELNLLKQKNSIPLRLGEYRLRSETAIICLASLLKSFFND